MNIQIDPTLVRELYLIYSPRDPYWLHRRGELELLEMNCHEMAHFIDGAGDPFPLDAVELRVSRKTDEGYDFNEIRASVVTAEVLSDYGVPRDNWIFDHIRKSMAHNVNVMTDLRANREFDRMRHSRRTKKQARQVQTYLEMWGVVTR